MNDRRNDDSLIKERVTTSRLKEVFEVRTAAWPLDDRIGIALAAARAFNGLAADLLAVRDAKRVTKSNG